MRTKKDVWVERKLPRLLHTRCAGLRQNGHLEIVGAASGYLKKDLLEAG